MLYYFDGLLQPIKVGLFPPQTVLQDQTLEHLSPTDLTSRFDKRIQRKVNLLLIVCQQLAVCGALVFEQFNDFSVR